MSYGGRQTLPFARLPIGAPGEGTHGQGSSSPHKRMRGGSTLSAPWLSTPTPRALVGGGGG